MNDVLFDPPPAPTPEPKKGITINPKYALAFAVAAFALLMLVIVAPGDKETAPVTTAAPAPVITASPAPAINKYDAYLDHVYNNSGQANTISKGTLIEYGDTICNALNQGRTIPWIVSYLSDNSTGYSDNALFASIIYGAITYICDEYKPDLNAYLAS
jgi:hypothetical protein